MKRFFKNMKYTVIVFLLAIITLIYVVPGFADDVKPAADDKKSTAVANKPAEAAKPPEVEKPTGEISLSALSMYYYKGTELSRNSVMLQPSVSISYKGFTANVWGNLDTGPYQTPEDKTKKSTWTETDVNLSYSKSLGIVTIGAGYSYFAYSPPYDGAARPDDQQEVNASVGLNVLLSPTLTVYKMFDKGRRWYIQAGLSHTFEFNRVVSLKLSGTASYMIGGDAAYATEAKYDDNANQTTDKYNSFLDGVLTASLPIKVTDHITITPTISYAFPLSTDAKNYMKGNGLESVVNNSDRASTFIFGGVIASFSF